MKERPILFSATMVRAILEGRKTQTRRVMKNQPYPVTPGSDEYWRFDDKPCPYGQPGDRLWVRETWGLTTEDTVCYRADEPGSLVTRWRPSIHMPRWASRITLEIVSVRVERLNEISEEDALAEGIESLDSDDPEYREQIDFNPSLCHQCGGLRLHAGLGGNMGVIFDVDCRECDTYKKRFFSLWESINGAGSWEENPFCWVIEFKRAQQ